MWTEENPVLEKPWCSRTSRRIFTQIKSLGYYTYFSEGYCNNFIEWILNCSAQLTSYYWVLQIGKTFLVRVTKVTNQSMSLAHKVVLSRTWDCCLHLWVRLLDILLCECCPDPRQGLHSLLILFTQCDPHMSSLFWAGWEERLWAYGSPISTFRGSHSFNCFYRSFLYEDKSLIQAAGIFFLILSLMEFYWLL